MIDNKTLITGSFNWSPTGAHTKDETLLEIHPPKAAAHVAREMDRLWESAELGITPRIQHELVRKRIDAEMEYRVSEDLRLGTKLKEEKKVPRKVA